MILHFLYKTEGDSMTFSTFGGRFLQLVEKMRTLKDRILDIPFMYACKCLPALCFLSYSDCSQLVWFPK